MKQSGCRTQAITTGFTALIYVVLIAANTDHKEYKGKDKKK